MNVLYSFNLTITQGYNKIILPSPILIKRGSLILLTQQINTTMVAIDTTGSAAYSDLVWGTNLKTLNSTSNWRFYFNRLTNLTFYHTSFVITHTYPTNGLYNIQMTFASSNQTFQQIVNITDGKKMFFKDFLKMSKCNCYILNSEKCRFDNTEFRKYV